MLTDTAARKAKAAAKDYKLYDASGLYLYVTAKGAKSWRMKYVFAEKAKVITFGLYPDVAITEARDRRDAARKLLRDGLDPIAERKRAAEAVVVNTFETVARTWHALHTPKWKPHHAADVLHQLERDVFPHIGKRGIADLDAPTVLATLRQTEGRGAIGAARRARQRMSAVFVYGIASGLCSNDPAAIIAGAMAPMPVAEKRAAVLDLDAARTMLAAAEATNSYPITLLALRFLALTGVRPGEVHGATWTEFEALDTAEPLWRIPKERMKGKEGLAAEHLVPLSRQAVDLLRVAHTRTGKGPMPFPNSRWAHRAMCSDAIRRLLQRAGYKDRHVPHGWRSTFSTVMNERAERQGRDRDRAIIDLMLAHVPRDEVEQRYNRAGYLPRRREIAQEWADLLLEGASPVTALLEAKRSTFKRAGRPRLRPKRENRTSVAGTSN